MTSHPLSAQVPCLVEHCQKMRPREQVNCPHCHTSSVSFPVLPGGAELQGGRYIVDHALGRGGFGVTYRAFHTGFNDVVAIKEYLPQKLAHRDGTGKLTLVEGKDEAFKAGLGKFIEEGRTLRRLKHTRGIRAHDLFEEDGTAYLVMEFIEGQTLRHEMEALQREGQKMGLERLDWLVGELVEALAEIHALDILHLDIKPENIMLTQTGHVVLVDFGSSRPEGRLRTATQVQRTEQYAPPEILARKAVGPWSDLYSLGAMICEILTGQCPKQPMARSMDLHKTGIDWEPPVLDPLWYQRLKLALKLAPSERPESLRAWWRETSRLDIVSDESMVLVSSAPDSPPLSLWDKLMGRKPSTAPSSPDEARTPRVVTPRSAAIPKGFVLAPSGSFWMGSKEGEGSEREYPRHEVKISRPFLLGTTPVTQGQWEVVMGNNPSYAKGERKPVECVNWWSAVAYCNALSEREGLEKCYELRGIEGVAGEKEYKIKEVVFKGLEARGYRLPTEAEWEYACRAGGTSQRYGKVDKIAWHEGNSRFKSQEVGLKKGNDWGLHDMLGNVWEWCWDWYDGDFYTTSPRIDPVGPESGHDRVMRGGSFYFGARGARAAFRDLWMPSDATAYLGFRCARSFH